MNFIFSTIEPLVRTLMFFIDNIVYGLISYLYELIFYLSSIDISNFSGAESLINRIYILLGVYMLFKLAFSIIQYIINPDTATNGEKGFGKLATNVMVALILLVSVPWIFQELYKVQGFVLKSNVIGALVMGDTISTSSEDKIDIDEVKMMAKDTQFLLYGAFASLNVGDDGIADIAACSKNTILGTNGMASDPTCLDAINNYFNSEEDLKNVQIKLYDFFKYKKESGEIVDERNFSAYGTLITKGDDGKWLINYLPIFSTLVGGYVALLLITFCIDIAARAIKLIFLQMVAPISIISYIDPKESVSNSKLRNWVAEVIKTWASLFIRLLVIFLIMKLVAMVSNTVLGAFDGFELNNGMFKDGTTVTGVSQMLIFVLLVIGAFQFAKKVPELLESVLGIKGSGDLSLNPFKTLTTRAIGAAIGSGVGGLGGLAANAINTGYKIRKGWKNGSVGKEIFGSGKGTLKSTAGKGAKARLLAGYVKNGFSNTLGSAIGGAARGAYSAGVGSYKNGLKSGIKESNSEVVERRNAREIRKQQKLATKAENVLTSFAGVKNEYGTTGKNAAAIKNLEEHMQQNSKMQSRLREELTDKMSNIINSPGSNVQLCDLNAILDKYTEQVYDKNSGLDATKLAAAFTDYRNSGGTMAIGDFKGILQAQCSINDTVNREKTLNKEIENLKKVGGIKES